MTIPTTIAASGPYYPNGATTVFPFGFKASADTDVIVVLISSAGVETIVPSSSYAVTLAAGDDPGGSVTFTSAPANDGRELWIYLDPTFLQEIKFEDEGAFNQTLLNQLADEAGSRSVWLRERINRAFLLPRAGAALTAVVGQFPVVLPGGIPGFSSGTGSDPTLRAELASSTALKGGSLVALTNGETVQSWFDKLFVKGVETYGAAGWLNLKYVHDDARWPMAQIGGIWSNTKFFEFGMNRVFRLGEGTTNGPSGTLFVQAVNEGSAADILPIMQVGVARANNVTVFGGNSIACSLGYSGVKLVPHEFDLEYSLTDASVSASSIGIPINVFSKAISGAAIQTGAMGGTAAWGNGAIFYGVAGTCLGAGAGSTTSSLFNSGAATYSQAAGILSNTHRLRFAGTASNHAELFNDASNNFNIRFAGSYIALRNVADTASVAVFENTGNLALGANANASGGFKLDMAADINAEVIGLFRARGSTGTVCVEGFTTSGTAGNAANTALRIRANSVTSRAINAGGTINASGADYAEYERRADDVPSFSKGDLVGFRADGLLTNVFADAVRFGIKSTNPNLVGGDSWADHMDPRPQAPVFEPPAYDGPPEPSPDAPKEFPGDEMVEARVAARNAAAELEALKKAKNVSRARMATAIKHAAAMQKALEDLRGKVDDRNEELFELWEKAKETRAEAVAAYEARVAAAEEDWKRTVYAQWVIDCAAWDKEIDAAREAVERIAYCGKVPCNFAGPCQPGDILVAIAGEGGTISAKAVSPDDIAMRDYVRRVGMVGRILEDGRPEVVVGVV